VKRRLEVFCTGFWRFPMPRYEFKCSPCSLRFEESVKMGVKSHPCPKCSAPSPKKLSSFGFQFASGKVPGNTGVDSLDSSVDKAVGRDADKRWETIKDRRALKRQVQHDNGGIGKVPLAKNPLTGEYIPVPQEELPRIQELHEEYKEAYEEHKQLRVEAGISKFREDDPYLKFKQKKQKTSPPTDNQ
jgi:putative FmdB family regulatory protein